LGSVTLVGAPRQSQAVAVVVVLQIIGTSSRFN
jgi:hypothetical protein